MSPEFLPEFDGPGAEHVQEVWSPERLTSLRVAATTIGLRHVAILYFGLPLW